MELYTSPKPHSQSCPVRHDGIACTTWKKFIGESERCLLPVHFHYPFFRKYLFLVAMAVQTSTQQTQQPKSWGKSYHFDTCVGNDLHNKIYTIHVDTLIVTLTDTVFLKLFEFLQFAWKPSVINFCLDFCSCLIIKYLLNCQLCLRAIVNWRMKVKRKCTDWCRMFNVYMSCGLTCHEM